MEALQMAKTQPPYAERFWQLVDREGKTAADCWLWKGPRSSKYRGIFNVNNKRIFAHRLAYVLATGRELQENEAVRHKCWNSFCCNPAHLSLQLIPKHAHMAFSGEEHPLAKLTEENVLLLRKRYASGTRLCELVREWKAKGFSRGAITRAAKGVSWTHVQAHNNNNDIDEKPQTEDAPQKTEQQPLVMLNADLVRLLRKQHKEGKDIRSLVKEHNTSYTATYLAIRKRTWKNLDQEPVISNYGLSKEPLTYVRGLRQKLNVEAFWKLVDREGKTDADCWPWTGPRRMRSGYGVFWLSGYQHLAHRTAYAIMNRSATVGYLRHICNNRACCNPAHLGEKWHGPDAAPCEQKIEQKESAYELPADVAKIVTQGFKKRNPTPAQEAQQKTNQDTWQITPACEEAFWGMVDWESRSVVDCWPWKGTCYGPKGYAAFFIEDAPVFAHRFVYEQYYEQKLRPFDKVTRTCNNPICCNPAHLVCSTRA